MTRLTDTSPASPQPMQPQWNLAGVLAAPAKPIQYELLEETVDLAPKPSQGVAQAYCMPCHSADYIPTQPLGLANPCALWTREMTEMQHTHGAPLADKDMPDSLSTSYRPTEGNGSA